MEFGIYTYLMVRFYLFLFQVNPLADPLCILSSQRNTLSLDVVRNPLSEKPMSRSSIRSDGKGISCGPVTFIGNTIPVRLNTPWGRSRDLYELDRPS